VFRTQPSLCLLPGVLVEEWAWWRWSARGGSAHIYRVAVDETETVAAPPLQEAEVL
jgi:hypothetical protein